MKNVIKIGNAQGFWGDQPGAAARLVSQQPDLDFLTMDYLAEVSLSLLAVQKERAPSLGYARDFVDEIDRLIPYWKKGSKVRVVVNAGGLNALGCARACAEKLNKSGCTPKNIAVIGGDDVFSLLKEKGEYRNLDTDEPIDHVRESLVSANAYLGAKSIVEALDQGADLVITGRVADPSLVVACCASHFQWDLNDYEKIAQATVAGHLIECGTQVTGGISTNWLDVPNQAQMGYPVVEMEATGEFVITKPESTGGIVNDQTVKEQLLYEIGDPNCYLSPDVEVSFLGLSLLKEGVNRIRVKGAIGRPPSKFYKVSATYRDGFTAEGTVSMFGTHLKEKAKKCGEAVLQRVQESGYRLEESKIECIGTGDIVRGVMKERPDQELQEGVLRISVKDSRKEAVECFTKFVASLVTSGAQGVTGYFQARQKPRQVFGFWPCLIPLENVSSTVEWVDVE